MYYGSDKTPFAFTVAAISKDKYCLYGSRSDAPTNLDQLNFIDSWDASGMINSHRIYYQLYRSEIGTVRIMEKYVLIFSNTIKCISIDYIVDRNIIVDESITYVMVEFTSPILIKKKTNYIVDTNGIDLFAGEIKQNDLYLQKCAIVGEPASTFPPITLTYKFAVGSTTLFTTLIPCTLDIVLMYTRDKSRYMCYAPEILSTGEKKTAKSGLLFTMEMPANMYKADIESKYKEICGIKIKSDQCPYTWGFYRLFLTDNPEFDSVRKNALRYDELVKSFLTTPKNDREGVLTVLLNFDRDILIHAYELFHKKISV